MLRLIGRVVRDDVAEARRRRQMVDARRAGGDARRDDFVGVRRRRADGDDVRGRGVECRHHLGVNRQDVGVRRQRSELNAVGDVGVIPVDRRAIVLDDLFLKRALRDRARGQKRVTVQSESGRRERDESADQSRLEAFPKHDEFP